MAHMSNEYCREQAEQFKAAKDYRAAMQWYNRARLYTQGHTKRDRYDVLSRQMAKFGKLEHDRLDFGTID